MKKRKIVSVQAHQRRQGALPPRDQRGRWKRKAAKSTSTAGRQAPLFAKR